MEINNGCTERKEIMLDVNFLYIEITIIITDTFKDCGLYSIALRVYVRNKNVNNCIIL